VPLAAHAKDEFNGVHSTSGALAVLLRPCSNTKAALVVSTGHRVSLITSARLVAASCTHSVVEPIRQADLRSRRAVRLWFAGESLPALNLPEPQKKRLKSRGSVLPVVKKLLKKQSHGKCSAVPIAGMDCEGSTAPSVLKTETVSWIGYAITLVSTHIFGDAET